MAKYLYPFLKSDYEKESPLHNAVPTELKGELSFNVSSSINIRAMANGTVSQVFKEDDDSQVLWVKVTNMRVPQGVSEIVIQYSGIDTSLVSGTTILQGQIIGISKGAVRINFLSDNIPIPTINDWESSTENKILKAKQSWTNISNAAFCWDVFATDAEWVEAQSSHRNSYGWTENKNLETDGIEGWFHNGVREYTIFKQHKGNWKNLPYSQGTYYTSACGATTATIICSGWRKDLIPTDLGNQIYKQVGLPVGATTTAVINVAPVLNAMRFFGVQMSNSGIINSKEWVINKLGEGQAILYSFIRHYVSLLGYDSSQDVFFVGNSAYSSFQNNNQIRLASGFFTWEQIQTVVENGVYGYTTM